MQEDKMKLTAVIWDLEEAGNQKGWTTVQEIGIDEQTEEHLLDSSTDVHREEYLQDISLKEEHLPNISHTFDWKAEKHLLNSTSNEKTKEDLQVISYDEHTEEHFPNITCHGQRGVDLANIE